MFDAISDTPFVLAYVFMSLLVLIVGFIMFNVVHKLYGKINEDSVSIMQIISTNASMKTGANMLEFDALKTG